MLKHACFHIITFSECTTKNTFLHPHILQTSIKIQEGQSKVNIKHVWDFDVENTPVSKHESIKAVYELLSRWQGIRTDRQTELELKSANELSAGDKNHP